MMGRGSDVVKLLSSRWSLLVMRPVRRCCFFGGGGKVEKGQFRPPMTMMVTFTILLFLVSDAKQTITSISGTRLLAQVSPRRNIPLLPTSRQRGVGRRRHGFGNAAQVTLGRMILHGVRVRRCGGHDGIEFASATIARGTGSTNHFVFEFLFVLDPTNTLFYGKAKQGLFAFLNAIL